MGLSHYKTLCTWPRFQLELLLYSVKKWISDEYFKNRVDAKFVLSYSWNSHNSKFLLSYSWDGTNHLYFGYVQNLLCASYGASGLDFN